MSKEESIRILDSALEELNRMTEEEFEARHVALGLTDDQLFGSGPSKVVYLL